jgi:hypothetical protein
MASESIGAHEREARKMFEGMCLDGANVDEAVRKQTIEAAATIDATETKETTETTKTKVVDPIAPCVVIRGLKKAVQYNGQIGQLQPDPKGTGTRWAVRLFESGDVIRVPFANCTMLKHNEVLAAATAALHELGDPSLADVSKATAFPPALEWYALGLKAHLHAALPSAHEQIGLEEFDRAFDAYEDDVYASLIEMANGNTSALVQAHTTFENTMPRVDRLHAARRMCLGHGFDVAFECRHQHEAETA